MVTKSLRLTELASCAGCAAKAGADVLTEVLRYLADNQGEQHPNLLVGLANPDDATVYRLNDEQALVATVDFFAPLVDDPYQYGAIAAANAMSDVYAMGGEVVFALNVAGFPDDLPRQVPLPEAGELPASVPEDERPLRGRHPPRSDARGSLS